MKQSILLAGVLAAFCATTAPALLAAQELTQSRQIIVNGEGEVTAAPDMATITLGVTHRADERTPKERSLQLGAVGGLVLVLQVGDERLGRQDHPGDRGGILNAGAHHLGGIDDSNFDEVFDIASGCIES